MKAKLDPKKIALLSNVEEIFVSKYGAEGEVTRCEFEKKSRAWYCELFGDPNSKRTKREQGDHSEK